MKNQIIIVIFRFILFLLINSICYAKGKFEGREAMENHPEVISYELRGQKHGAYYKVTLTGNRIIEFSNILSDSGSGFYAAISKLGEYWFLDSCRYRKSAKQEWKICGTDGIYFTDLSQILDTKIETMVDCIDNYNKIYELAKFLANEQYKAGCKESANLQDHRCLFDSRIKDVFPFHFALSENREAVVTVLAIYEYPQWFWDGVQEDEMNDRTAKIQWGENWVEKVNADLPKIRKSLGLE